MGPIGAKIASVMAVGETSERQRDRTQAGMAVAYWAQQDPSRPAVISPDGDRTFAELNGRANQLARVLRAVGLEAGDGVALLCRNRPEFAETWAACQRAGLRFTTINWHLTRDEVAYIVEDSHAQALIVDGRLSDAVRDMPTSPHLRVRLAVGSPIDGFDSYEAALAAQPGTDLPDPVPGTLMLYTSGTTGRPKGVWKPDSHPRVDNLSGYRPGNVHLCTGPLYHTAPLTISLAAPLQNGATVVMMDEWDGEDTLRLIEQHHVTHTHMVPTMFHRLLHLDADVRARHDLGSLRLVVHGAAPCPVEVKRAMIEWFGPVLVEYYAATEGVGTVVDSGTWLARPGTVGRPAHPEHIKVGDEDAGELPRGQPGLVWLRSLPGERFEYFQDTAKTDRTYRGEYFTLGDVGYLDDDGYLFITDRDANVVISGGVNIYPAEVDAVLLGHPAVADAAAFGVPNDEWGEELTALVELRPGSSPSPALAEELQAFCRARLARFKCPRSIGFVERLPRDDNGKVYKRLLRARSRDGGEPG